MADLKHTIATKLLWIDLEMTGLDPKTDRILEVAAIATDFDFNELGRFEAIIQHDQAELEHLLNANEWYAAQPEHMKLFVDQNAHGRPESQVEQALIDFTTPIFGDEPVIIAGNSIHNDRGFIKEWWPQFDHLLHYRMLDVSSFKILFEAKYNDSFVKQIESHRALDDIQESIDELKHYLERVTTA